MIHLVTDSTSDLTQEQAASLQIRVVPLTVIFGEEERLDGVDIFADEFYSRLPTADPSPRTSQPTPEQFAEVYRSLLSSADDRVLSIHIGQTWSGTVQSASLAAQEFDGRVVVVDSKTVSAGMQVLVRAAVRDLRAGAGLDDLVRQTEERRGRVGVYVLLDTLTYLQRGGRIGRAQAFLGGVLKVKPLLGISDGEIHPVARARSRQQGVDRMLELLGTQGPLEALATMHSAAPELMAQVSERLVRSYPGIEVQAGELGPVIGTYAGPGAIGIAWLKVA